MNAKTLGGFFRQFRQDRGLNLNQAVAGAGCSAAALSRFERGQNDLSIHSVRQILRNLQMDLHDFLSFTDSLPEIINRGTYLNFLSNNLTAVADQNAQFAAANARHADNRMTKLLLFVLCTCQRADTDDFQLTADQEERIALFLQPFPYWNYAHSLTIAAAVRFGSSTLRAKIAAGLIEYAHQFTAANITESTIPSSDLAVLLLQSLAHREMATSTVLLAAMTSYHNLRMQNRHMDSLSINALDEAPLTELARLAYQYVVQPSGANRDNVHGLLGRIDALGAHGLSGYCSRAWTLIVRGLPSWTNNKMPAKTRTHQQGTLPNWQWSGATIAWIRHHYKLALTDLSVNWASATESRFEAGKTQFGFRDAFALTVRLAIDVRIFYGNLGQADTDPFAPVLQDQSQPDFINGVLHCLNLAKLNLPTMPHARELLATSALTVRAIKLLRQYGVSDAKIATLVDTSQIGTNVVSALANCKALPYSDFMAVVQCTPYVPTSHLQGIWRRLLTHARFNPNTTSELSMVVYAMMFKYAINGQINQLTVLQQTLRNIYADGVNLSGSMFLTAARLIGQLITDPSAVLGITTLVHQNSQTIQAFVHPVPEAGAWFGDIFTVIEDTLIPAVKLGAKQA
ncbi:helix-turn-helix domain-containing protein [Lacticaseibacillus hulanensis]|uniref:helix-turn-helix domain-containing protein n=1 Tax=Lacticaseibacillus hulanensis TaxID=2493111 RepID=UPI000FDC313C|nr:helix-turn-helix transcriptional regulator [Lacticaseibacillus hulanensis]